MARFAYLAAALVANVAAQTVPFTDSNTGISFAAFQNPATGLQVGIALPETIGGDFIAQLVAPAGNATGWAGMAVGSGMINQLLVAAWPDENEILQTFRRATDYVSPPVDNGSYTALPIAAGTFVNTTHYSYTFLCSGCLTGNPFFQNATGAPLGWALSTIPLADPSDANGPLTFHSAGQGIFTFSFADAQSAQFDTWAALARPNATLPDTPTIPTEPEATTAAPTSAATSTSTRRRRPTRTRAPVIAPTGALPSPTSTRTRKTRTRKTRTSTSKSSVRTQAAKPGFVAGTRPAFSPEVAKGDDYEDAMRFKASFLDGYYKN